MNPVITAAGELLYRNRVENGLTQSEMAEKCNLSVKDYINFENGKTAIPLHTFIEISIICQIDINAFVKKLTSDGIFDDCKSCKISYFTESENLKSDDGIQYTAYNVIVKMNNTVLTRFSDVFFNEDAARHFVDMCNRLELDPMHVADVIDDVLIG